MGHPLTCAARLQYPATSHTFWREATLLQVVSEMARLYYPLLRVLSSMSRLSLLHVWEGTGSIFSLVLLGGVGGGGWTRVEGVDRLKGECVHPHPQQAGQKYLHAWMFARKLSSPVYILSGLWWLLHVRVYFLNFYMYSITRRGCLCCTCTQWPGKAGSLVHVLHDLARLTSRLAVSTLGTLSRSSRFSSGVQTSSANLGPIMLYLAC